MKIGFEAKRFFTNFTGLGNYSRFVVDALSRYEHGNTYYLYSPKTKEHPEVNPIITRNNVTVITPSPVYNFFHITSLWRSWGMRNDDSVKQLNVYHGLSQELPFGLPRQIKKVVTVHDLIYIRYPQFYNPIDVAIYKAKVKSACQSADKIIAISNQTAQDLVEFLKVDRSKIEVVYQGCHPIFKQKKSPEEIARIKTKYRLPDRYILSVGTIEERKNTLQLVKALSLLPPEDRMHLVLTGRPTEYKKKIVAWATHNAVLDWVIFLHDASFADFPAIYQGAQVFAYPSIFEGFGIPLVEAIESGIPVITSTGSCFSEAAGPGAIYVDPGNDEVWANQLRQVLHNRSLRDRMIMQSSAYIKRFQPQVIAGDLQRVYTSL